MAGPAAAAATVITTIVEGVERVIAWAKKKKAEDQVEGAKVVAQMRKDTAEIERRAAAAAAEATRKP